MTAGHRVLMLLLALALAACATPREQTAPGTPPPRAERPAYTVGEKWIRSDGEYELIRIEENLYVFAADVNRQVYLTKDLTVAKIVRSGGVQYEFDPPPTMTWPLEVGGRGTSKGNWRNPHFPQGVPATLAWSVQAYEDIHLPAGTFKAFRIDQSITSAIGVQAFQTWYVPDVRQLAKMEVGSVVRFGGLMMVGSLLGSKGFRVVAVGGPVTPPLQVALETPKDRMSVTTEEIEVAGKVTSGKGVARVSVTLNGQEVSTNEEKTPLRNEVALKVPLKLREGRNVLLVTATDSQGTTREEARTLFRMVPVSARTAGPPGVSSLFQALVEVGRPIVNLSSPADQSRVEQESIALAAVVSSQKGVRQVVVAVNGVEVSRHEERAPLPEFPINLPLMLRDGPNTVVVTATDADGRIQQEVRTVHYEKRVPLTITVRYPEYNARVSEETTVVAAVVTSSKGVAKVSVTLNGIEVHQQTERTPAKSLVLTAPMTLREGANAIVVSASEADGTVHHEIRTVIYDKPKVAAPRPLPPAPARDQWAVIVGIGRYESSEISRLRYSVPDAEAIHQVLTGPAGFKPEHIHLLTDSTERKPTLRNLKWALGTFLARSAKKDDTVLIFFAGHGAPEVDQRGIERDGLAKYLIPSDADPDDLYSTAFPMDELQTIFGRIEAERVVVFLDACYSGAAGGRTFASKKTRAVNVDDLFLERLTRAKGRAILTASRPAEVSLELADLGHGLFTYYLLRGLQGAADLNRDGIVSLQELYEYVEQQVSQKARAVGGNQHPVMKGELEGVLPLVKVK